MIYIFNFWRQKFDFHIVIWPMNCVFHELQGLIELIFWYIFQFSILTLKESSKRCLIFSYFFVVFEKLANLLRQELSLKESLISVYLSCAAENLKRISQGTTYSNYLNKQGSDFRSLAALMFPLLMFWCIFIWFFSYLWLHYWINDWKQSLTAVQEK